MQFIEDIRAHLEHFETEAKDEIHRFLDWVHDKFSEPQPAVPANPAVVPAPVDNTTYVAPVTHAEDPAPVEAPAPVANAPVVEAPVEAPAEATAPVAETPVVETPAETPAEAPQATNVAE